MELNVIVPSATTFLVGLFAFILYRIEKNDKEKSAANIVLEEIRTIETNVDKLKESGDLLSVIPVNLSTTGWFSHRYTLVKYLDFDEISQVGLFFERVEALKEMLSQWRQVYFGGMSTKTATIQEQLVDFANIAKDREEYEKNKKKITDILHTDAYWFEPSIFKGAINSKLDLLNPISTTTIGNKIKKIGKKSWFIVNL